MQKKPDKSAAANVDFLAEMVPEPVKTGNLVGVCNVRSVWERGSRRSKKVSSRRLRRSRTRLISKKTAQVELLAG